MLYFFAARRYNSGSPSTMKGVGAMTVGEKIQYYRKKIGFSQDELGQKLLVSRQTVSLWEMDKTMPTIDNLLRLKDIFGVTVDDILNSDAPKEAADKKPIEPLEQYRFSYSINELEELRKKTRNGFICRILICTVIFLVLYIVCSADSAPKAVLGAIIGVLLYTVAINIAAYRKYKHDWKNAEARVAENEYSYKVFDDYFWVEIDTAGELKRRQKIYFSEIEKAVTIGQFLVLTVGGQGYYIKKSELHENSAFYQIKKDPEKQEARQAKAGLRVISIVLFVCSIASIWSALFGVAVANAVNRGFMEENMWVFFLFTPIPIASIIYGLYLKKNGFKYKKNIIVGIIMTALLCIYGSFSFIFSGVSSHSDEQVLAVEQELGIDIPQTARINFRDYSNSTQSMPRGYVYKTSDLYFEKGISDEFESALENNSRWMTEIPNGMVGITAYYCELYDYDYLMVYNAQTQEFNSLPGENGTYRFINLLYDAEGDIMYIIEYDIEYTK